MALFINGSCSSTPEKRQSPSDSIRRNSPKVFYTTGRENSCLAACCVSWQGKWSGLRLRQPSQRFVARGKDAPQPFKTGGGEHFAANFRRPHYRQPAPLHLDALPQLRHPFQHRRAEIRNLAQI